MKNGNSAQETYLIVAPHHDDECIGAGGLLAKASEEGASTAVVIVFGGECGVPGKPTHTARRIRELEARKAGEVLGISQSFFLRFPDRSNIQASAVIDRLISVIRKTRPTVVLAPHPLERDYEHKIVSTAVREACWQAASPMKSKLGNPCEPIEALLFYEVWSPMQDPTLLLDISKLTDRKYSALRCHQSQLTTTDYEAASRGLAAYRGVMGFTGSHAEAYSVAFINDPLCLRLFSKR